MKFEDKSQFYEWIHTQIQDDTDISNFLIIILSTLFAFN